MTSRGNSSISPPVQISVQSQPRQVTALPSGTPPPQHFYTGQTRPYNGQAVPQGVYEFHPQAQQSQQPGQQLLSYQAYGSAPNDIRVSGGSGRGAPPQQPLTQGGAYFQQQQPQQQQNMRSQQPQQGQQGQSYYISTPQNNLRQPRPQQPFFMIAQQQPGMPTGGNVVIPAQQPSSYPAGVPLFTPPTGYSYMAPNPTYGQQPTMYYQPNGQVVRGPMPMNTQPVRSGPAPRERKVIQIKDPSTGADVTNEFLEARRRAESETSTGEPEEIQQNAGNKEVQQQFAIKVAEALQGPGGAAANPAEQSQSVAENGMPNPYQQPPPHQSNQQMAPQQNQQNQQIPPQPQQNQIPHTAPQNQHQPQQMQQQQQQQPPQSAPNMIRHPHMMPPGQNPMHQHPMMAQNMMGQPPNAGTGPEVMQGHGRPPRQDVLTVNLNVPPPAIPGQVRAQAQIFVPQHQQTHIPPQPQPQPQHGPRHPQAPNVRPAAPPATMPPNTPPPQQVVPPPSTSQPPHQPPQQTQQPPQQQQEQLPPPQTAAPVGSSPPAEEPPVKQPVGRVNSGPSSDVVEAEAAAPVNIPSTSPAASAEAEPVVEKSPSPPKEEPAPKQEAAPKKESTPPVKEDSPEKPEDSGASTQSKDVRKGNKKKKEFNRKDIGGSEMDAFIDPLCSAPVIPSVVEMNVTCNNSPGDSEDGKTESTKNVPNSGNVNVQPPNSSIENKASDKKSQKSSGAGKNGTTEKPVQELSKHQRKKNKKNKKKNGRKSPIQQREKTPEVVEEGKENEAIETKPPLPPTPTEKPASAEPSPVINEVKPTFSYAAAAISDKPKEASPKPVSVTKPTNVEPEKAASPAPAEVKAPSPAENVNQNKPSVETSPEPAPVEQTPAPAAKVPSPEPAPQPKEATPPPPKQDAPKEKSPAPAVETPTTPEIRTELYNDENTPPPEEPEVASPAEEEPQAGPKVTRDENGRLVYDRAYLMELRSAQKSLSRPVNLPDLEIILDTPMQAPGNKRNASMGGSPYTPDFAPSYFSTGVSQRQGPGPIGQRNSRSRQGPGERDSMGPGRGPPPKVITRDSMGQPSKLLHKAENAWKPKQGEEKNEKSLESEALFIMNRLTPTNFEKLAGEMRKLKVVNYDDLKELVKIFFDKVTIETKFVSAYAQLCKVMAGLKVPPPPGVKETAATFRVVMLTKCQQEFEADKSEVFEDPEEKRKKLEAEIPKDEAKRDEKIEHVLYHMKLRRLKFYGNIRFIGELFKLGMLTENIMHDCIFRLLKARDDDSLVSLCNLITTVGKALDVDKAKARMDQYFAQMSKIAEERKSRIKFTLKDVLELRSNCWVARKEQIGPKKIDEVHKDFEQEQATKQFLQNQPPPPRNDPMPNNRRGSRQRQEEKPADDGWNTVGSKSMRMDPSKMRLSKPNVVDENSIQLGPGGGMATFGMWGRGSFGGAKPQQEDRPAPPSNRFQALRDNKDQRQFERSPSRESGSGRGMRQGTTSDTRGKMMSRSSQEGERRDLLASARSIVGGGRSQNSSRENSWNRQDRRQNFGPRGSREADNPMTRSDITPRSDDRDFRTPAPPPAKKVKQMSDDEIETKAKNILEEYLNIRDMKEAKLCVSELAGQDKLHLLVTASINDVLEGKDSARQLTGEFCHEMVKCNLITLDQYIKGLNEVLMYAEDMMIDIPMLWPYLAQLITPLLVGGSLTFGKLVAMMKTAMETKKCIALLLAQIVLQCKDKLGEDSAAQLWQSGGSKWSEFLPADDVDAFLKDKKIEFVNKQVSGVSNIPGQDWQSFSDNVETLIRDEKSNADVIAFIQKTAGKDTTSSSFIRAVTTSVASSSISRPPNAPKANEDTIKARKDILQHFIKSNPKLELQALYAIQSLMTKLEHPSGVISCLFDTLYDEEVISEESCKQWEKSTDPAEQEGKGVCSMQLTQFFTWLSENDEPEGNS